MEALSTSARASLIQQRLRHLYESGALAPLLAALKDVNGDLADTANDGPRYAVGIDFRVIEGARHRLLPIALFLPAFGGPSGDVDCGAQWLPVPRDSGEPARP